MTDVIDMTELTAHLRELHSKATPGLWLVEPLPDGKFGADWKSIWAGREPVVMYASYTRQAFGEAECHHGVEISEADGILIAAMHNALPALLDTLERYRVALEKAKEDLIWSTGGWGQATKEVLEPARIVMQQNIEAIDSALNPIATAVNGDDE